MEMPKPTAEHKQLEKLAGSWSGKEQMHPSPWDPKGGEAQASSRARMELSGFALVVDYEQTCGGQRTFSGHGVYTWDAQEKQVVLHWFDCMGQGAEVFRGQWSGERLELESKNPMGFARLSYDCSRPGAMSSRMEMSPDGVSWSTLFEGSYRRKD